MLSWLAASTMILLIALASGSADLFLYSPDIDLHIAPPVPTTNGLPAHGTIVEESMISPALGGQKRSLLVYLPPSYDTPQGRTKRYPTLYLLHGSPGSERDWFAAGDANQSADTLIAQHKTSELILVLPDGNGRPGQTSEWGNSFDGRQNMETFVAVDLVHYVDAKYRTIAEPAYRGIGGLSMGGFGAMNIAVHHPDVFGFVISLGGYYTAEGSVSGNNAAYIRANSPQETLPTNRQAWNLHIFLGAATKDQPYDTDALQFAQVLGRLHIQYRLDVEPGYHSWRVWQVQFYHVLLWLRWRPMAAFSLEQWRCGLLRNGILFVNVHPLVHIQTEGSIGIHMLIEERC
jgi:enterochelin esterase-like enzyme